MREAMKVKPLAWRKPTDHPCDDEEAALVADGIGGRYAIRIDGAGFTLWWAHDEFTFAYFDTLPKAKTAAQADFDRRVLACLDGWFPAPRAAAERDGEGA